MDLRIALAGNPNSGKTTLFNALTAARRFSSSFPRRTRPSTEALATSRASRPLLSAHSMFTISSTAILS